MKIKIDPADKYFSLYIRERDNNKCRKCGGTSGLQCSHFQGRRKEREDIFKDDYKKDKLDD